MFKRSISATIRKIILTGLAAVLLLPLASVAQVCEFVKTIETDLDGDGTVERIDIDSTRDQTLQVWHGETFLWQGVPARWKPWKIAVSDVDGDGKREIAVGVFKSTKFFPKPHNCLFIYGFDKDTAFPKWLGSSLSRPFDDFIFADAGPKKGDELIAIETTADGRRALSAYFWDTFGFTRMWERGDWDSLTFLEPRDGRAAVAADGQEVVLEFNETR